MIIASSAGHSEIVAYLLELDGVDVNAVNSTGQTAMHYAASKDRFQVMRLTATELSYLHHLISVQPPLSTRSSSLVTLAQPPI